LEHAQAALKAAEQLAIRKIFSASQPKLGAKTDPSAAPPEKTPTPVVETPPAPTQDKSSPPIADTPPEPQPVLPASATETGPWIFPDSNQRLLSPDELARLSSSQQARQAINEIYARKGFIFKSADGRAYAKSLGSLYRPVSGMNEDAIEASLSSIEKQNRDALVKTRAQLKAHEGQ